MGFMIASRVRIEEEEKIPVERKLRSITTHSKDKTKNHTRTLQRGRTYKRGRPKFQIPTELLKTRRWSSLIPLTNTRIICESNPTQTSKD
jgi:hypothetical protein